jgi:hypothetical protein
MWIKWKYNDHGWRDFQELEIPDDFDGEESVEDYLIQRRDLGIPTWSERFMVERIHWEKLNLPPEEVKARKVKSLKSMIDMWKRYINHAEQQLKEYEKETEKS